MKSAERELKSMRINVSLDINDERDAEIIKYLNKYGGKTFNAEFARSCMYLKILNELTDTTDVASIIAAKVASELQENLSNLIPTQAVKEPVRRSKVRTVEELDEEEYTIDNEYEEDDEYYDDDDDIFGLDR